MNLDYVKKQSGILFIENGMLVELAYGKIKNKVLLYEVSQVIILMFYLIVIKNLKTVIQRLVTWRSLFNVCIIFALNFLATFAKPLLCAGWLISTNFN